MTTKQLFLVPLCLLLFVGTGYSQMNTAMPQPPSRIDPVTGEDIESSKEIARTKYWNNVGIAIPSFFNDSWRGDPEFRAVLGVSEEYYQKILASERDARGSIPEHPGYQEAQQEYDDAIEALTGQRGAFGQIIPPDADADTLKRFDEAVKRVESISQEFLAAANRRGADAFDNALTPELKQKFQEIPLAVMVLGETSPLLPGAFAALNLTNAQREQMERIKKELEPEFERHLEICADAHPIMFAKSSEAFREGTRASTDSGLPHGEDRQRVLEEASRRFLIEDSEYQAALDKVYSSARAFARQFTTRMSETLNDEQRKRLQDLIDNPPLHVRIYIQRLREQRGERTGASEDGKSERAASDKDIWVPGPDSWKPGDPLPGVYRQERNAGGSFPRPAD